MNVEAILRGISPNEGVSGIQRGIRTTFTDLWNKLQEWTNLKSLRQHYMNTSAEVSQWISPPECFRSVSGSGRKRISLRVSA